MLRSLLRFSIFLMLAPLGHSDEPLIEEIATDQVVEEAPAAAAPEPEASKDEAKQDAETEEKPAEKKRVIRREGNLIQIGRVMRLMFGGPELDNNNEDQIKQIAEQFTEQFRPLLASELRFIRLTCPLAPADRPKIRAAGEAALKDATRKMAEGQFNRGGAMPDGQSNIRDALGDALAGALRESISPEEVATFEAEAAHRADRAREAAILTVVSHLDGIVFLKEQQRIEISKAISENWQPEWESWRMISRYGNEYFPAGADPFIAPALSAEQLEVWGGLQKVDFGFHFFNDGVAPQNDDDWWNGADEPQPGNPIQPDRKAD